MNRQYQSAKSLPKVLTGIRGFDDVTFGGLPKKRPTLICGGAGCGKTVMAMEFLVRGILENGENGIFVSFEERPAELIENFKSLGMDLESLIEQKKLIIDYISTDSMSMADAGSFDLDGLMIRIRHAIGSINASRIVLDTCEVLFSGALDPATLRLEIGRLFNFLKDQGVTSVITAEKGRGRLTRFGLEEYVSDCVVALDHRIINQVSTRRIRIMKYRGSVHGTNEYPFLIDSNGFSVLPVTSSSLDHQASEKRVSTGIKELDQMFSGKGYFKGSSILISGVAGSGKSTMVAQFCLSACQRGEKTLYFAFEESPDQIRRNMQSAGIDLGAFCQSGQLLIQAHRPTSYGLEMHLLMIMQSVEEHKPDNVIIDPITNFLSVSNQTDIRNMLIRVLDFLKSHQITAMFTSLVAASDKIYDSESGVSSLIDSWILLTNHEVQGVRDRRISIRKSRGMAHSDDVRSIKLSSSGILIAGAQ